MSNAFARTVRSLDNDSFKPQLVVIGVVALLGFGWVLWLVLGSVTVYAVAESARFEAGEMAHPVQTPVDGIVESNHLALGATVHAGDVLLTLDSRVERLSLDQEIARRAMNATTLEAFEVEIDAEQVALQNNERATGTAVKVARARGQVAAKVAGLASRQNKIVQELRSQQLASGLEALQSTSDVDRQRVQALSAQLDAQELASTHLSSTGDRRVRIARLRREQASLQGQIETSDAVIASLRHAIDRRSIRSPVDGVVADVAVAPAGAVVTTSVRLASIVPRGDLRLVAHFRPAEAVGRVRPGQTGVARLDGFPWAQYGTVPVTVYQVASEPTANLVRIEMTVREPNRRIPMTHGLTGTVEVAVERVAPYVLVLRSIGQLMVAPPSAPAPATTASAAVL